MDVTPVTANAPLPNARLIEPIPQMGQAYRRFLREFIDAGEEGMLLELLHTLGENEDPGDCVRRLRDHAAGLNLPDGSVSYSTYWLLSEEEMLLGEIRIRHMLTPALEDFGGHIGYMVRPGERGKGYATLMLALSLEKCRALGLKKIMVACQPGNTASARVISNNGGRLIEETGSRATRMTTRYWIDL